MIRNLYFVFTLLLINLFSCAQSESSSYKEALKLFEEEKFEESLIILDALTHKDGSDFKSWCLKGRSLHNLGRSNEGLEALNKAITLNPSFYRAYGYRAVVLKMSGSRDFERIITDIKIATENNPDDIELKTIKATIFYEFGMFDKALAEYKDLLKSDPGDYKFNVFFGSANRKLGNNEIAFDAFNKAIMINSLDIFAFEERAFLYMSMEKFEKAVKDYEAVLKLIPKDEYYEKTKAYTYNNKGLANHKAGKSEIGLKDIDTSINLLPTNPYAYRNRAIIYFDIGDSKKGCSDLKKSISLGFTELYGDEVEKMIAEKCK